MAAPCAEVPLPGGNPAPSGPMLMSQSARSASVTFWPRPGVSAASAPPATTTSAVATVSAKPLHIDMLGLPLVVDRPAHDVVHVAHRERRHRRVDPGLAAFGPHVGARRLHVAGLVEGAALQHHRLTIPAPGHAEAGKRFA